MFQIARYSGVTAALALLAVGVWSLVIDRSAGLAFAEVQEQVKKARTVQYIETRTDPQPDGGAPKVSEQRHLILGRYLQRTETLDRNGQPDSISIIDAEHGTHVVIEPKVKRFVILSTQVETDFEGTNQTETEFKPSTEADIYKVIREIPAQAKPVPEKMIDNRRLLGFVFEEHGGGYHWKRTYWVDAESKLPVRIEISARSDDKRLGPSDWVQTGFVFDEKLDAALFSTTPPADFQVETQKLLGIRPPK
jgi:outer membrane lipoprotein-sorting protein